MASTRIRVGSQIQQSPASGSILFSDPNNNLKYLSGADNGAVNKIPYYNTSSIGDKIEWLEIGSTMNITSGELVSTVLSFDKVAVATQTTVTAAAANSTLTIEAGSGITITTNNTTKTVTITASGVSGVSSVTSSTLTVSPTTGAVVANLATLNDGGSGTFLKFTRDTYGRVSGTSAVTASDITTLVDGTYVNVTGDSMSGTLTMTGGATVTGLPAPSDASDAVNKAYVDNLSMGLDAKYSVRAATTVNITLSGTQTIDGVSVIAGNRVLVKNQSTTHQNGIYVVAAGAWTRATDNDDPGDFPSAYVWVEEGTTQADTGWVCTTDAPVTVGSTAITWVQFSSASGQIAGNGLTKTGNTIDVVSANNGILANADNIELKLATNSGLEITAGGSGGLIIKPDTATSLTYRPTLTSNGVGIKYTTGEFTGTDTITLGTNGVAFTKLAQLAGLSVLGNSTNATANMAAITASTDHNVLRRNGTSIGFGAINLASTNAVTGILGPANGGVGSNISSSAIGDILVSDGTNFVKKTPAIRYVTGITGTTLNVNTNANVVNRAGTQSNISLTGYSEDQLEFLLSIYRNGLLMSNGASRDYTISSQTITFAIALETADHIKIVYLG